MSHKIATKIHEDGRKDVQVNVSKLNLADANVDQETKDIIEKKVFKRLSEHKVKVVIAHRLTNKHVFKTVSLKDVRNFAKAAIEKFVLDTGVTKEEITDELIEEVSQDFLIIQYDPQTDGISITNLYEVPR